MRRALCVCLIVVALSAPSAPVAGEERASGAAHLVQPPPADGDGKKWSLVGVGGMYFGLSVWAYFAWYHDIPSTDFKLNGDGYFGADTYAGGADKLGHFWANNAFSRIGAEVLIAGGWKPLPASLISSGLATVFFLGVELKDGFYYQFSTGDLIGNLGGAALSALMVNVPAVDRAIDFRVEYFPSADYRRSLAENGDLDIAEDYSGQTYLLAFHLESIPALRETRGLGWTRYVDLVGGFKTRGYKPEPMDETTVPSQHLFFGVSLNMQQVLAAAFGGEPTGWRRAGHLTFELLSPPYTTLPAVELSRSPE